MTPLERAVAEVEKALIGHVDPTSHAMSEYGIAKMIVPIVLLAIREPSERMNAAAMEITGDSDGEIVRHVWQAMIDAALAEEE